MKRWSVTVEDRRAQGGPWVVFVRRARRRGGVSPSCVGVGADSHSKSAALGYALAEVRQRRRAGQFSDEPCKVMRMCFTVYLQREGSIRARHVTTSATADLAWNDTLNVQENHAAVAALLLGREPEIQASTNGGGFIFGVDPAND